MAKYHFLTGADLLDMDEAQRIATCVEIKAAFVSSDERESGKRALLNYGHTLAHALEIETEFALAHGEAVAVGLLYAAHLARRLGRIDDRRVEQHYAVVGAYELDTQLPEGCDPERLIALMSRDKKALGDGLTFVLDGSSGVEVVTAVPAVAVRDALTEMLQR
jgi:5-deoxy-5-amino-3-dehydroquinate synthase